MSSPLDTTLLYYDAIVIGGGIVGSGIFRDLSINGVNTLLVEKKDFSSQTSSKSSKMLHGGIRYLENMDFDLVWEALHEKNLWIKIAPHLCYESKFILPIYLDSIRPKWMIKIGLFIYDLLSSFQNTHHQMYNKDQVIKNLPQIKQEGLKGGGVYSDAIVDDARLGIELIHDGVAKNNSSKAINYISVKDFIFKGDIVEVRLKDELTDTEKTIRCKELILATGPFTDDILSKHKQLTWTNKLLPSKGSHIWLKSNSLDVKMPTVLTPKDGRVIFVIPQKDNILVGTTEIEHTGDKFDITPSQEEIDYLLTNVREYFPNSAVGKEDIITSFSALRPLVKEDATNTKSKTARNHKYYQPRHNLHVIIGGKYTTFRVMAKEITQVVCSKLNKPYNSSLSRRPLDRMRKIEVFKKNIYDQDELTKIKEAEYIRKEEDLPKRLGLIYKNL